MRLKFSQISVRHMFRLTLAVGLLVLMIAIVVLANESDAENGKAIFQQSCAKCHGVTGKGEGYRLFNPPPADLTSPAILDKTDETLLLSIREGHANTAMGTYNRAFSSKEMQDVLAYIRKLQEK